MSESLKSKIQSAIKRAYAIGDVCHYGCSGTDCDCPWCAGHRRRPLVVGDTVQNPTTECRAVVEHIEDGTTYLRTSEGVLESCDETRGMSLVEWTQLTSDILVYYGDYPTLLVLIDRRYYLVEDKAMDGILGYSIDQPFYSVAAATKWLQSEWYAR